MERVTVFKDAISIAKVNEEENTVFGWASVAIAEDGSAVVDGEGDVITPDELRKAAYEFTKAFGEANVAHAGPSVGNLVTSLVVDADSRETLGITKGPKVGWYVGFQVDDATFAKVKDGTLSMFSIEGTGKRVAA